MYVNDQRKIQVRKKHKLPQLRSLWEGRGKGVLPKHLQHPQAVCIQDCCKFLCLYSNNNMFNSHLTFHVLFYVTDFSSMSTFATETPTQTHQTTSGLSSELVSVPNFPIYRLEQPTHVCVSSAPLVRARESENADSEPDSTDDEGNTFFSLSTHS